MKRVCNGVVHCGTRTTRCSFATLSISLAWLMVPIGCRESAEIDSIPAAVSVAPAVRQAEPVATDLHATAPVAAKPSIERGNALQPADLVYQGAFRLPAGSNDSSWEYSGYAMTYYPGGDVDGPDDGYPGSLFAVGHDHQQLVSEIAIPPPVISAGKELQQLNTAQTRQPFQDIRGGMFPELEIPRAGLEYLPAQGSQQRCKLHFAWGQHMESGLGPTHGWCELDLSTPQPAGPWQLGGWSRYVTNDYLFEIPEGWAARYAPGMRLATGRFRDGTWSGLGPALLAYGPWTEGNPPPSGSTLKNVTPLLMYGEQLAGNLELDVVPEHAMQGFQEPDEWSAGAWLVAGGKSAVVLIGTKAVGKSWYGFGNGVVYPTSGDPNETVPEVPPWPHDARGWWSERIEAQMIFSDPADLAAVATGQLKPWEPQPYASLSLDSHLFDTGYDHQRQKRYLVGGAAYDRVKILLYLMERRADGEKCLVHVFQVGRS